MAYSQHNKQQGNEDLANQIIDYRNGRYQGSAGIYCRKPNGKGMFLDQNYLFVLSDWLDGYPSGKTVAIYPNHHMFYGNLLNNRPNKLCAYKQPQKYTIYLKNFITQNHIAIIDDYQSQSLLVIYVNYKEWTKFTKMQRKGHSVLIEKESKVNKLIEVISHQVYLTEEEKWNIIEEYFKEKLQTNYKNYSAFIKSSYQSNKQGPLISRESSTEYELGYEGSSIVCKMDKEKDNYSIKLMGIYDEQLQAFEVYKRNKGKDKAQQFVKGIASITYTERPKTCVKNLRQFYKKSTIFCNSFVNIKSLDEIQLFFTAISHYVDYFLTNKYAQTFILKTKVQEQTGNSNKAKDSQILKAKDNLQSKISGVNVKYSQCQSLYQNQDYSRVKVLNHHSHNQINKQNQQEVKSKKKNIKPLTEINSFSSSLNLVSTDLKYLTKHLYEIQQQIKKSNHQTPPKSCKHSNNNSQIKKGPSPKANTAVHSHCKQSKISSSQSKLKRQQRLIWR